MKNRNTLFTTILLVFACFGLLPRLQAVTPPPGGGYAGGNTAEGQNALSRLTTGVKNTANGYFALFSNTTGQLNTAIGSTALYTNSTGFDNTAVGFDAMYYNTIGNSNTASGYLALFHNITGSGSTAIGFSALMQNTTGNGVAIGANALLSNTVGGSNTACGNNTLLSNINGFENTAIGEDALSSHTTGNGNVAVGAQAGTNLTTGDNNVDIANVGVAGESNTIRIGHLPEQSKTFIAGISGVTVAGGVGVIVDTNGQLGTVVSSERFKDEVKPMDKASEAILALKPVTFRYKKELDPEGIPQFGLVAEDVEKVNPDLVARDDRGKPYTVRYEAVNAMLLNEFLKEHRTVQEQGATIARQQKQIEALTAGLQEVSAQLELNKPAPQTVLNNN
jgi:trimeric autotransporter adhesin